METYYLTPVESSVQVYCLTPVKSEKHVYYLTPVGSKSIEAKGWKYIATVAMNAANASTAIKQNSPGSYAGYFDSLKLTNCTSVKFVAASGSWNDGGTTPPDWHASLDVVTQVEYEELGPGVGFYDSGSAADAWEGSSVELKVGEDGFVWWGIYDISVGSNYGTVTFRIYGKWPSL